MTKEDFITRKTIEEYEEDKKCLREYESNPEKYLGNSRGLERSGENVMNRAVDKEGNELKIFYEIRMGTRTNFSVLEVFDTFEQAYAFLSGCLTMMTGQVASKLHVWIHEVEDRDV